MKLVHLATFALPLVLAFAACSTTMSSPTDTNNPSVSCRWFGVDKHGAPARLWTLRSGKLEVDVTDHGATLVAVRMPDRAGFVDDVVLGFDDVTGYESGDNQYFGCTTGRVCNRIAKVQFSLDGYLYRLATNNAPNHLHGGGPRSLDKVRWQAEVVGDKVNPGVRFSYTSPDGEEGYPGNLTIAVTYTLFPKPDAGALTIAFEATTDKATPVNLTNHAYWNLSGAGSATVLDHVLQVDAARYTPTDDTLIPTGAIAPVAGTPLDFRQPRPLGLRIDELTATAAKGIDHNFVLDANDDQDDIARLGSPQSGRWLEVRTSEPGLQVYTGNFLFGQTGKGGRTYAHRSAVCLETQHFPDSVNQPNFPNTVLQPGKTYTSATTFTFGVD